VSFLRLLPLGLVTLRIRRLSYLGNPQDLIITQSIFVQDYDAEFENYDPLFREDVAKACTRLNPVLVTDPSSGESTPSELLTGTLVLEQERGRTIVAYQSYLMGQKLNRDLVRTSACAVSEDHVYSIILSTTEELDSPDTPTYEKVLKVFVVLK
jgi:hypothetical protein